MNKVENNIFWINILKVVCMFGVVLLHAGTPVFKQFGNISISSWWAANIYDSVARISVPIFFMISGYFLLEQSENLFFFIKKRIKKVVIPLVAWSIVFLIWKKIIMGHDIFLHSFYNIIISPVNFHLWFIYVLIGIYFFIPILRIFIINSDNQMKYYFVIIWFFAVSIIPQFEKYFGLKSQLDFMAISGFVGYFVLGNILRHLSITKKLFIISNILFLMSYIFTVIGTYFVSSRSGTFNEYFYGYLSPNIIILSVLFFISIKYVLHDKIFDYNTPTVKLINVVSKASLGIYIVHPIILYHLGNNDFGFTLFAFSGNPIIFIPLTAIIAFLLSYFIISVLQKIWVVKYLVP